MNKRPLINALALAGFGATALFSVAANAVPYVESAMPSIQNGFPSRHGGLD